MSKRSLFVAAALFVLAVVAMLSFSIARFPVARAEAVHAYPAHYVPHYVVADLSKDDLFVVRGAHTQNRYGTCVQYAHIMALSHVDGHAALLYAKSCAVAPKPERKHHEPVVVVVVPGTSTDTDDDTVVPPAPKPEPEPEHHDKPKCNNGFGNGPDTACKTHGNAQNQDNNGQQVNGHVPGGAEHAHADKPKHHSK